MVFKFFPNLKESVSAYSEKGITLIELIVVIAIITAFSLILVSDFPKIQRQFSLSRAAYKLAQDLRRTQDLGLSGVKINDGASTPNAIAVKGYGIYVSMSSQPAEQYILYADVDGDQKYSGNQTYVYCDKAINPDTDCVIELVDVRKEGQNLFIKNLVNVIGTYTSVNFSPPEPFINIDNRSSPEIGIVLGLDTDSSANRTVWVNTSGLITVK